jgi:cytochrome P450
MPAFHGDRIKVYGALIQKITDRVMAQIAVGHSFLGRDAMQSISLAVILEAVFGFSEGDRHDQLAEKIKALTEFFRSPLQSMFLFFPKLQKDWGRWSPWGSFLRNRNEIDQLIFAEIADRRADLNSDRTDILSLLLAARDEQGQALSDQELRDELLTLLFAGHETTATAMAWGLYWFNRHPETLARLRSEIASLGNDPEAMDIFRLPYLTAFCQETLRIYPVAMLTFPRVAAEPVNLLGYTLAPETIVMGCIYLVHQREDLYPNPQEFRPDRFLERQFSPYEFIPFGGGSRRCIGEALALFELKLVIAKIAMEYDLQLADSEPEKPRRRGVTLSPAKGVRLILKGHKRSNRFPSSPVATVA